MSAFDDLIGAPQGDEGAFKTWYAGHAGRLGLNPNPDDPQHFYDYRAAFKAGAGPGPDGHWPSQFKREGHPRMVIDGINTKTGQPAGALGPVDQLEMQGGALSGPR